jgi:hypothetical protein
MEEELSVGSRCKGHLSPQLLTLLPSSHEASRLEAVEEREGNWFILWLTGAGIRRIAAFYTLELVTAG